MPRVFSSGRAAALAFWSVVAAFAGAAGAQPVAAPGADVIVGDLPDVTEAFSDATQPGLRAYAVGTLSCNAGSVPLSWIEETPAHPAIGQNVFRIKNGRIEQIGQSWLKHGFTALQGYVCAGATDFPHAGCAPYPTGDALGVGCSDPYSAALNSDQFYAGPKSEINAATGVFPYPISWSAFPGGRQPAWTGALSRRIVLRTADIDPAQNAGAVYVAEGQYVAADDAASGNSWNNNSYRRIAFSPGSFAASLQGPTQRTRPAIAAWQEHGLGVNTPDPDVRLQPIDVPGDGRFWIGWKVTPNADGTWRYEYAIQNLTSDRSAGSFTVPIPAGASVTNQGFRDVDYHSGEIWSNADWTVSGGPDGATWASPQTYAQNPGSNALRWGTLYNFWFDCSAAPAGDGSGSVRIGLFKPGQGAFAALDAVGFAVATPGGATVAVPNLNDACAAAMEIRGAETGFSTVNAATEGPDECVSAGSGAIANDLWFRYTDAGICTGGQLTVSTCGSSFDTRLAVYRGSACPTGPGAAAACNDDDPGVCTGGAGGHSRVQLAIEPGETVLIRVGGYAGTKGNGILRITAPSCPPPLPTAPVNNACASAIWVADNVPVYGTNIAATTDGSVTCVADSSGADVWYRYVPAINTSATVRTSGLGTATTFDTVLSIHAVCGGPALTGGCDDDDEFFGDGSSRIRGFSMTAGQNYYIRVAGYDYEDGFGPSLGNFGLLVVGGQGTIPAGPSNDACANRAGLGDGSTPIDTTNATTDGPATSACGIGGDGQVNKDVWFNYPALRTGTATFSLCGAAWDTRIAAYTGDHCSDVASRLLACADDSDCNGDSHAEAQSRLTIPIVQGASYTIRIGGAPGASGPATLAVSSAWATGACCSGASCSVTAMNACEGAFQGPGTVCSDVPANPTTCCPANFDEANGLQVADIFAFLRAWFAQNPSADFDGQNGIQVADIFSFLRAWFAGC